MEIAYVDVFRNFPANSGNDWYTLQLVTELAERADVRLYYTQKDNGKHGYWPKTYRRPGWHRIEQELLVPAVKWWRISRRPSRDSMRATDLRVSDLPDNNR